MDDDLVYSDDETCRLEPLPNPFGDVVGLYRNGAPRPMKMGTIASPWRYDGLSKFA
jgi:hypothetical protein